MTDTLANGYSSESTQQELSIEYQHDRVEMFLEIPGDRLHAIHATYSYYAIHLQLNPYAAAG